MNHLWKGIKRHTPYLLLTVLFLLLTILLFIKEEQDLIIITKEYPYSIYHSNNYETIDIEILTNNPESYHFNKDYITDSRFYNDTEEISIKIKEVDISNDPIHYLEETFYQVVYRFQLPFVSEDYVIEIEDAQLLLTYDNAETIDLSIGALHYLFHSSLQNNITLSNLSATHEVINGYNTIGGVNIELSNTSQSNIIIRDIRIVSNRVHLNLQKLQLNTTCEYDKPVTDCINEETYDFFQPYTTKTLETLLGKNNSLELYIPLQYEQDTDFIYEFSIQVEYEYNNQTHIFVIDNFPFMRSSLFQTLNEEGWNIYHVAHSN